MPLIRWQTGYCTNVHAGRTLEETIANLREHAAAVRRLVQPDGAMGVGLWLAQSAAQQMLDDDRVAEFRELLGELGLLPYTLNGFPYGDFHQDIVRHQVYEPTWCDRSRTDYTLRLIQILDQLLPPHAEGSISTLPIAWGQPPLGPQQWAEAAAQLFTIATALERMERDTGRLIYVCIEPEPGCAIQRSSDMVHFFEQYLFPQDGDRMRRYVRVCHDVCHAAVMFEDQQEVLERYLASGILVGKVQVSSAVVLQLDDRSPAERAEAINQLRQFVEPRYLHQTVIKTEEEEQFFEDLPQALASVADPSQASGEWRVHFHVPIYLERFGAIETSRWAIDECFAAISNMSDLKHLEVETYAWGVLPPALQHARLADGIAAEMQWLEAQMSPTAQSGTSL